MTAKKEVRCGTGATRGGREAHRHRLVLKTEHRIIQAADTENQRPESTKHVLSLPLFQFNNAWTLAKTKKNKAIYCHVF